MNGPYDPGEDDDDESDLPPDDSDTEVIGESAGMDVMQATSCAAAFLNRPEDHIGRELNTLRQGLAAQLQDVLAALDIEQVANDQFRKELGYEPLGVERVYSGPELDQHRGVVKVSHWVGNGMQTRRES